MVQQNPFEKAADLKHKSAVSEHFNLQNMPPQRISLLDCFILQKVSHFHCFGISQLSNYCGCKMCCLAVQVHVLMGKDKTYILKYVYFPVVAPHYFKEYYLRCAPVVQLVMSFLSIIHVSLVIVFVRLSMKGKIS